MNTPSHHSNCNTITEEDILNGCINRDTTFFFGIKYCNIDFDIFKYPLAYKLFDVVFYLLEIGYKLREISDDDRRELEFLSNHISGCMPKKSFKCSLKKALNYGLFDPSVDVVGNSDIFREYNITKTTDIVRKVNPQQVEDKMIWGLQEERILGITAFSDTHGRHNDLIINECKFLICCGDVTSDGNVDMFVDFMKWFSLQKSVYKIYVPGNNDSALWFAKEHIPNNIIILNNKAAVLDGIKFYGTPLVIYRKGARNNSFSVHRMDSKIVTDMIPIDTDILITHGPAYGIGDMNGVVLRSKTSGDYSLRTRLKDLNLKYHIFGHNHGGRGCYFSDKLKTIFINTAGSCYHI